MRTSPSATNAGAGLKSQRPTIKDVAAHAGVSLKTVSRVVNEEAGVKASTRKAVLASIGVLGFRRNAAAAALRQGQTSTIGLVVKDISEPFQSSIAHAVESVASSRGAHLFAASSADDAGRERQLASSLSSRQVDGLIIIPSSENHSYLAQEIASGLAVVFLDCPAEGVDADTVLSDNRVGARKGVEHLIDHGHRRISYIGESATFYTAVERFEGYREALERHGIGVDPDLVMLGNADPERIRSRLLKMQNLSSPPTALFTGNSVSTLATLRVLGTTPLKVAHVAFDDFELFDLLTPGITVVAQDPAGLGTAAAELLFQRIAGDTGSARTIQLHTRLIQRGSGELTPEEL
ncbi:transcriptional regulator, LacI family (plasmid) [Pseudarthrobacter chlorophenolicus A6]|uniref:Transcriptional regulator, LacI family n=1 Tax=Pseudarthrobacter chlorophenolicus (strain ATCC 700700 / DSM 12829 / CIP 107037 / JCM 12360 / KCTC 9906 / NCIMB 13794 / A6) TaxID=452863 RepID=B8HJH3_PSECP|nr:LacI family DNA-binding transcriptional regulator [Pseudarthrobacter chlorophenolicus]ACL42571.1 transcriptional regulator, LacI family [Pseudarthrobacter chlorophenolicus A6]SDQ09132.1 transcriptional regulator, LacI family [Pseudarthrobacter chlorophenolicus]